MAQRKGKDTFGKKRLENTVVKTEIYGHIYVNVTVTECSRVYFGWSMVEVAEHAWVCL